MSLKQEIQIDDLFKVDIRMGKVLAIFPVEKSKNLKKLKVDFGDDVGIKNILTNVIVKHNIKETDLLDNIFPFILNLKPTVLCGELSEGMIIGMLRADNSFELLSRAVSNAADIGAIVI